MTVQTPADRTPAPASPPDMHLIERAARLLDAQAESAADGAAPRAGGLAERIAARQDGAAGLPLPPPLALPAEGGEPGFAGDATARRPVLHAPVLHDPVPHDDAHKLPLPGAGVERAAPPLPATGPTPGPTLDLGTLANAGMAMGHQRRTRTSEEYRITAGRILRSFPQAGAGRQGARTLLVTSALPGEGKSFCALNIAGCMAQHGMADVVLVDIDPKPESISALLGLSARTGFLDLPDNPSLPPDSLAVATEIPGLHVVPIGIRDPEHIATAGSRPAIAALQRLVRAWPRRLLVLDAPPCLSASDPNALAPVVDQTVMVIEAGRTQRSEVEAALDFVKESPAINLLLNKAQLNLSHTFGANGDYHGYF